MPSGARTGTAPPPVGRRRAGLVVRTADECEQAVLSERDDRHRAAHTRCARRARVGAADRHAAEPARGRLGHGTRNAADPVVRQHRRRRAPACRRMSAPARRPPRPGTPGRRSRAPPGTSLRLPRATAHRGRRGPRCSGSVAFSQRAKRRASPRAPRTATPAAATHGPATMTGSRRWWRRSERPLRDVPAADSSESTPVWVTGLSG